MAGNIDIISPAIITVLDGTSLTSLDSLPPDGIALIDSNSGAAVAVTLTASAANISLSASSAGGASVASNGATLTITGSAPAVNAALASLNIASANAAGDTLTIMASDSAGAAKATVLALAGDPNPPPAFVAPPSTFSAPMEFLAQLGQCDFKNASRSGAYWAHGFS